jgi:perosamine synthetase
MQANYFNSKNFGNILKIRNQFDAIKRFTHKSYLGFVQGHAYLSLDQLEMLEKMIGLDNQFVINEFEDKFSKLIGNGHSVLFAAGRMGFFALMKVLGVGAGDEVILQGHTCSVMPNAVWRTGATPIYSDIDPNTFGSSVTEIEKKITSNTKMIVAQHSFGIPCNIEPIVELARSKGIFLLEDCAISMGSKINGIQLGNFGDAALFSIDHTKPINAFIGGFIFTQNIEHYIKLKEIQQISDELPIERKKSIWKKILFERKYYNSKNYGKTFLIDKINRHLLREKNSYLTDDYTKNPSSTYPFPAIIPSFLAQLGLIELEQWKKRKKIRQDLLKSFLELSASLDLTRFIPTPYYDKKIEIVPLRFVYTHPCADVISKNISKFVDISWFWFEKPIIACEDPQELGYISGSCPISEKIGQEIINWPCVLDERDNHDLLEYFRIVHT